MKPTNTNAITLLFSSSVWLSIGVGICNLASAAVINVNIVSDIGPNHGSNQDVSISGTSYASNVAPVPYGGNIWNDVPRTFAFTGSSLLQSDGLASGITISLTDNGGNTAISSFSYSDPTGAAEIQDNYWYVHNGFGASDTLAGPVILEIQGLDTSGQTSYDFTFISQGDQTGQGSSITIGGMTKESLGTQPNTSGFVDGVNYLQFDNLTPDSGGNILVSLEAPTTGDQRFAVLNGLQIQTTFVAVPEPSATLFFSIALLGLVRSRSR